MIITLIFIIKSYSISFLKSLSNLSQFFSIISSNHLEFNSSFIFLFFSLHISTIFHSFYHLKSLYSFFHLTWILVINIILHLFKRISIIDHSIISLYHSLLFHISILLFKNYNSLEYLWYHSHSHFISSILNAFAWITWSIDDILKISLWLNLIHLFDSWKYSIIITCFMLSYYL